VDRAHDRGEASELKDARKLPAIGPEPLADPSAAIEIAAHLLSLRSRRNGLLQGAILKLCEQVHVLDSRIP